MIHFAFYYFRNESSWSWNTFTNKSKKSQINYVTELVFCGTVYFNKFLFHLKHVDWKILILYEHIVNYLGHIYFKWYLLCTISRTFYGILKKKLTRWKLFGLELDKLSILFQPKLLSLSRWSKYEGNFYQYSLHFRYIVKA